MVIKFDRNNLTCLFTEADWEYWFKKEEEKENKLKFVYREYLCPYCSLITRPGALTIHCRYIHNKKIDLRTMQSVDN